MELLKDYDVTILYHPGKANVVADALSRKTGSMESLAHLQVSRCPLARIRGSGVTNRHVDLGDRVSRIDT